MPRLGRFVGAALAPLLFAVPAAPQTSWSQVAGGGPQAREFHAMAYDSIRDRVVLFGGVNASGGNLGDTWEWDGQTWSRPPTPHGPRPRVGHAMAFDSARGRVVLYGGSYSAYANPLVDTWEWDGQRWTQAQPTTSPRFSDAPVMAFDSARNRTLMYDGGHGTWEWDGQNWQRLAAGSTGSLRYVCMAFDAGRGRVLRFGGWTGFSASQDTFAWNGSRWVFVPVAAPPVARMLAGLVFDEARGRIVLAGSKQWPAPTGLRDTWEWDGVAWIRRGDGPRRGGHAMVYATRRAKVLSFGGRAGPVLLSDLWEYGPDFPASYVGVGTGCAGSAGTPSLAGSGLPWIGTPFSVQASNLPAGQPAVLSFGASSSMWSGTALPLSLAPIGMPGCHVWSSIETLVPLANPSGTATAQVGIPAQTSLLGASYFNQVYVVDPGANPLGVTTSNAARATLGGL